MRCYQNDDSIFVKKNTIIIDKKYNSVFVHTPDSIFVLHERTGNFALLDSKGNERIAFTIPLFLDSCFYRIINPGLQNTIFTNPRLYLTVYPHTHAKQEFYDKNHEIVYNIDTKQIEDAFLPFPAPYSGQQTWGSNAVLYSKCYDKEGNLIYAFNIVKDVFLYTCNKTIRKIKIPASQYLPDFPPPPQQPNADSKTSKEYNDTMGHYIGFYYDSYRDIYLRMVRHPQPLTYIDENTQTLKRNLFFDREWSLMFFDADFQLLGEQKFEKRLYYARFFVLEKGLLIPFYKGGVTEGKVKFKFFTYKER